MLSYNSKVYSTAVTDDATCSFKSNVFTSNSIFCEIFSISNTSKTIPFVLLCCLYFEKESNWLRLKRNSLIYFSTPIDWNSQMKRLAVDTYNEFCNTQWHLADHYQHSNGPIVSFITPTAMKFIQIYTLVMRKFKQDWLNYCSKHVKSQSRWSKYSQICRLFCSASAKNKAFLRQMGITHILNTAEGSRFGQVDTGHAYYRDLPQIRYMGFPLTDHPSTDISRYFYIAAKFIDNAISSGGQWAAN